MNKPEPAYRFLDILGALFVAVLLISNVASTKIVDLWKFTFDGGTLLFPLSYIFGDILTEVYGFRRSRRIIWLGLLSSGLMSLVFYLVQILPAPANWNNQEAFESILGVVPRIVLASLIAFFAGEFSNAYILSRLKVLTNGKYLWIRTISSTLVGQGIDTMLFCLIAFYGVLPDKLILSVILSNYLFKCGVEVIFTPITYLVTGLLKKRENNDPFDRHINYNPFGIRI